MKHNLLKSVILSVILLMGVSNTWAGDPYLSGFGFQFEDDGGKWFKNSTEIMNLNLGSKTNLKIVYIYANGNKNGGNLCGKNYFKYGINGTTSTSNWGGVEENTCSWSGSTPTYKWGAENGSSAFIDLVQNKLPGNYSMEFIFSFNGANNTYDCGTWYDCKYSGGNWKFSWSIPDPVITITGANNLVVGTSTNIKAQISQYPIGATLTKVQVSGNLASSKSATGSTDNLTVSSVTPNASGKNGITVTVTVKFGTGGTKDYTYTYNVTPPAVNDFKVAASNVVSGTGKSGEPYVIACGKTTTLTVSGNKASTDANSSLYAKFGNNAYASTLTKTLTPSSTTQSIEVKAKHYNSKDALSGAETTTQTIYYRAQTFDVNIISSGNGTVNPSGTQQVGATNVSISATPNIGYQFVNWTATAGITIANPNNASTTIKATKAGTVTANFEAQPATTIYLEPTSYWNSDNPQYVAHVWNTSVHDDIIMIGVGEAPYKYYKAEVPYGYTDVVFFRNSTDGKTLWNQTADLTLPNKSTALYEIKSTGNKTHGQDGYVAATGEWKEANLFYTITLGSSMFGPYGISYNGQSYFSKDDDDVIVNIPYDATITFIEGQPYSDIYTGDIMEKNKVRKFNLTQPYTVLRDVKFESNYVTKVPQVAYLGVPNNNCDWNKNASYANFIWRHDSYYSFPMTNSNDQAEFAFEEDGVKYYKFTIPAGCNMFQIQRKQARNDDENNTSHTFSHTCDHKYMILNTGINCYMLDNGTFGENTHTGHWCELPPAEGDYRLLYVEQEVRKSNVSGNEWKTVIARTHNHPSDIVKPYTTEGIYTDTVSLHVRKTKNGTNDHNPEIILQRYNDSEWVDIEAHMVNGPLEADAGMAMLPGRRNAGTNAECDDFVYDDGIEVIKNDQEEGRVWNFKIQQTVDAEGKVTAATLLLDEENLKPYEGRYYIRTNNTKGGWSQYTHVDNHMTFSSYAKANSGYSHYYCKYVDIADNNTIGTHKNVKFIIANDYGTAISQEKADDDYTTNDGTLPANANVRWQWNMVTNEAKRAYIQGSAVSGFLTVTESDETTTTFRDNGNWIYEADITAKVNEKITAITAPYNNQNQSLLEEKYQTGGMPMLTGDGENTSDYTVRVQYDFKINKTVALLIPGEHTIASAIDVLIEREDQGDATQVSVPITASNTENGYTVYAVMSFTQYHIEGSGTQSEKLYYWVSFPFDVRISDVFGFGEYGVHWIMEYYDGAERAEKGCWADSPTYWRYITDTTSVDIPDNNKNLNCGILKANQGYVLALALNIANMGIFTNTDKVSLYFPSMEPIKEQIDGNIIETTVILDEYECTIERDNRDKHDSNWHIIGVPSYSNKQQTLTQNDLLYYYTRDQKNDTYTPTSAKDEEVTFKSLHSYMVQYAGTINWAATWTLPQGLAAKRNAGTEKTHSLRLELSQNGTYNDQTLITLQEEGATEAFDMNLDLSKMMNAGNNIYTLAGEELIQVAGNALPIANTTIPVGVQIVKAGEYTFAMPDGTAGITVELIDYETNTRTNLLFNDYTVNLPAGTNESRFALYMQPSKVATDMENISDETTGLKKYIIDGQLFLQKDGMLYDAQGHIVR